MAGMPVASPGVRSFGAAFLFWWVLLLAVQQAQRLVLIILAAVRQPPAGSVLLATLATGLRADFIVAGFGMAAALLLSLVIGSVAVVGRRLAGKPVRVSRAYTRALSASALVVTVACFLLLLLDMGYYRYSGQRLDFVFIEYVTDLSEHLTAGVTAKTQAGRQTAAEAQNVAHWIGPLAGFLALEIGAIVGWSFAFRRWMGRAWAAFEAAAPRAALVALLLVAAAGAWGFHPAGPETIQSAGVADSTYYALAQNPIWYVGNTLENSSTMRAKVPARVRATMPERRALPLTRKALDLEDAALDPRYPFVRATPASPHPLARRPNVLLLFVEALDRRYLGRTELGVRVTPFLDRLLEDSVSFTQFHSNGAQTFHGMFATLCSALPRHGIAATKARYANDYLCLPSLLKRAGYRTQMVIGQSRDRGHSRLGFSMARNGLDELLDDANFPASAPRMGLGLTDGALFGRLLEQLRGLQAGGRPWFLTTLTTGTHHPFIVPEDHPDVKTLYGQRDRYLPALRYVDLELERFFTAARRDGLLRDTVVLVLGDHGRHETPGAATLAHRATGDFVSPFRVWLDPSLRAGTTYRPRGVPGLASQVDVAPTILGLAGLTPHVSPFVGRDLTCALGADCLPERSVYVSDVYDNLVGVVDRTGFWFYSLDFEGVEHADLDLTATARHRLSDPDVAARVDEILALYVTSTLVIEENRLWSWREFGPRL
jgi:hypothetical protein